MDDGQGTLQPWQIFSGLFVGFWATSAYFDHFVMTFVFCIAFGVLGEVLTSYFYGRTPHSSSFSELKKLAVEERNCNARLEMSNEATWRAAEEKEEEEEEEEEPPPLPDKDYDENFDEDVWHNEYVAESNQVPESDNLIDISTEPVENDDVGMGSFDTSVSTPPFDLETAETDEANNQFGEQQMLTGANEILKKEEDEEINILLKETQQVELENLVEIQEAQNQSSKSNKPEDSDQFLYKPSDFEDLLAKKYSLQVDEDEEEPIEEQIEKKFYAPDSSDDEELEEEYANREVDFDESESEEEEFVPRHSKDKVDKTDEEDSSTGSSTGAPVADQEEVDLDLNDPKLQEAAAKIQTVFKGFQVRKKNKMGLLR